MFRTRSSAHVRFHPLAPTGITTDFQERIDANGVAHLVKIGVTDLNAVVQAQKESCMVYNILDRFQNGDLNALSVKKGFFGDVTQLPSSLAEAHNLIVGIEAKFNQLPLKIREAFGNSAQIFAKKLQDGSYAEIFEKITSVSETTVPGDTDPQSVG